MSGVVGNKPSDLRFLNWIVGAAFLLLAGCVACCPR